MRKKSLILFSSFLLLLFAACNTEESDLGVNLVDPSTIYNSKTDTLYANLAYSLRDDSLATTGGTYNIVGWYADPTFGKVNASIYTQIALQSDDNALNLGNATIDSVVLSMVKDVLFPDTGRTYTMHFEIMPLDEAMEADSTYYGFNTLAVRAGMKYFDNTVTIGPTDTVVRFTLGGDIATVLAQNASASDFVASAKGLRIRVIDDDSDTGIVAFNFAATKTRLTAYFHHDGDTTESQYIFVVGNGAKHFMHFDHDYTGTIFDNTDSIGGSQRLYLEPFGGYKLHISFDSALRAFHTSHPTAAIHYAEMLLPVADEAPAVKPDSVLAFGYQSDGTMTQISDQRYYMGGDGAYQSGSNRFRLRVSMHLQHLLYQNGGSDYGTCLMLYYSRKHPAARTIINGTSTANPVRIVLTYTEN